MSQIDRVMRELSDLRSFYLKLQQSKRTPAANESVAESVAEAPADYNAADSGSRYLRGARTESDNRRQDYTGANRSN